jgi:hypothetical protein
MKFRVHFTVNGDKDFYDLEGDTVREIRDQNILEMKRRQLDFHKNDCWSEELSRKSDIGAVPWM